MSRHKNFARGYSYDDDYDDDMSDSYGHSYGNSVNSPTTASYMIDRSADGVGLKNSASAVKLDDSALMMDLMPQLMPLVNPCFAREDIEAALRDCDYNVEQTARYLAEQESFLQQDSNLPNDAVFAMDEDEEDELSPPPGFKGAQDKSSGQKPMAPLSEMGKLLSQQPLGVSKPPSLPPTKKVEGTFAFNTPSPDDEVLQRRQPNSSTAPKGPVAKKQTKPTKKVAKNTVAKPLTQKQKNKKASVAAAAAASGVSEPDLKSSLDGTKKAFPAIRADKKTKSILAELAEKSSGEKERLNMVVIGHVDAGKSTLVGHLLSLLGMVDNRTMHKHRTQSEKEGKGSFHFAWVMDSSEEERKRGVTIDVGLGHFETQHKSVTLMDAPGHLDFVPNMIMGAAQAEVALLVVDCTPSNFESGFSMTGQTREHALLARSLGCKQLIVVINKMDSVGWDQARYNHVKNEMVTFLTKTVRFRLPQLEFVPVSGFQGTNLISNKEPKLQWYNDPPLVSLIDKLNVATKDLSRPARFYVTEVLGRGDVPGVSGLGLAGKVEGGIIAVGDSLLLLPVGQIVTVKSLKLSNNTLPTVVSDGDSVEMGVVGMTDDSVFGVGDILCDPLRPIAVVRKFRAQIVVFQPPRPLLKGDHLILHMHSISVQCKLSRLRAIVNKKTGDVDQKRPRLLPHKSTAIVDIRLDRPLCMELFTDSAQFGRFMLRSNAKTCAAGVVTSLISTGLKSSKSEGSEK